MRDSMNIKDIPLLNGYSYEGLYLTEYKEIYFKLWHVSGVWVNVHAKNIQNYFL